MRTLIPCFLLIAGVSAAQSTRADAPQGFSVAGRSGQFGMALTAEFQAPRSARAAFRGVMGRLGSYFDSQPSLQSAFADPRDSEVQGFFRARYRGMAVSGLLIVGANSGQGSAALLYDRDALFNRSLPVLSRQIAGGQSPAPRGPAHHAAAPAKLQPAQLLDGSGWIGLAPGWKITGSYKGIVDAVGPNGEILSLGGYQKVFVQLFPGAPPQMSGPIRPPWQAFESAVDVMQKGLLSSGRGSIRLIEQSPVPYQGGASAYLAYELNIEGTLHRGLAFVITAPLPDGTWFYYCSMVGAPEQRFAQVFPTLWAMWKSWSVNPAIYKERMDDALKSMRETYALIQDIHNETTHAFENENMAADETIRGVTMIEDMWDHWRGEVDTNSAQAIVDELNRQGYQYRIVPNEALVP